MLNHSRDMTRRKFLSTSTATAAGVAVGLRNPLALSDERRRTAQIAITLDLEMSRHYPRRGITEWDYQKGNLDEATKAYAVKAARIAKERGGLIHFFCVGRVLEQKNIDWLKQIAEQGHPIGNHTYDHVNVKATEAARTQYRFQRAPWLVRGQTARQIIHENILTTNVALKERAGLKARGFRTPGGFHTGLSDREDVQQLLLDLGFKWVSSKYPPHLSGEPKEEPGPDVYESIVKAQQLAQPFRYPSGLVEVPMSPISDVTGFRSKFWKLDYFLKATRLSVEWAIRTGSVFDFLAHPSCLVVEDPECRTIQLICDLVKQAGDKAAIVDLDTIAARVPR